VAGVEGETPSEEVKPPTIFDRIIDIMCDLIRHTTTTPVSK